MCGRYALGIRAAFARHQLQQHGMPVDDAPDDEETRATYNFAPGYYGLVYRADTPPEGAGHGQTLSHEANDDALEQQDPETSPDEKSPSYKLQSMKWGLVPFWTKRNPDYGTLMKTINARDDSLAENRGMWTSMKKTKRCIVVAEGFYEWLKKNGGRDKIPHFTKRKDGQLMLFAGLWDCVTYEDSSEQHWTYTIITTDSNKQLSYLHDRMPVILENGSEAIQKWLDPKRTEWTSELQSLLKPYDSELDCYPVSKEVGKVGNNSPNFVVPISSSANKNNIANFFANAKKTDKPKESVAGAKDEISTDPKATKLDSHLEKMETASAPKSEVPASPNTGDKRGPGDFGDSVASKIAKRSPVQSPSKGAKQKSRSATSNNTSPVKSSSKNKDGSQKITKFFTK